jgi:YYY domain-containing protein
VKDILIWWLVTSLIGWGVFPITFLFFHRLPGRGYAFSRALGLLLAAYLLWAGASLHVLQNDLGGIALCLVSLFILSAWLVLRPGGSLPELRAFLKQNWRFLLAAELLFAISFLAWAGLRAYAVGKIMRYGGEKMMEIAFLNGILNSRQFPPLDPWLSGFSISYYYFGYVMMALLTRLTGVVPGIGFDLYDALLFSLTALGAFGLVYEMTAAGGARRGSILAALLGALLTAGMGNLEGLLEALYARGWLPVSAATWLAVPGLPDQASVLGSFYPGNGNWWWWRASRVLYDLNLSGAAMPNQPITEFPFFSFLLGDNHPHVLALPFALLAAAVGLQLLNTALAGEKLHRARIALFGLVIGSLVFLNTWDFPIYLGLALLAWLVGNTARTGRLSTALLWNCARLGLGLTAWTAVFYFLFFTGFSSQAGGLLPYIFPPTRLAQYLVMFGPFIFILVSFLAVSLRQPGQANAQAFTLRRALLWWLRLAVGLTLIFLILLGLTALALVADQMRGGQMSAALLPLLGSSRLPDIFGQVIAQRVSHPWLFLLLTALISLASAGIYAVSIHTPAEAESVLVQNPPPDAGLLYSRLLAFAGLTLTFSLEFFYLRDGFGVRMNTVFKFYFQGWVLMACASGFGLWWMLRHVRSRLWRSLYLTGSLLLILAGMVYPALAIPSRTNGFSSTPNLDGTSELRRDHPDDWAAIDWLLANGLKQNQAPVLLEAPGKSYTYDGRISTFTGYPAVLGWAVHELQWRGSYTQQALREPDISTIYTTTDPNLALSLLRRWQVQYVILGQPEREYISTQCARLEQPCDPAAAEAKFTSLLTPVFTQGSVIVFEVP